MEDGRGPRGTDRRVLQRYRLPNVPAAAASVVDRHLFYNPSRFDGAVSGPPSQDDLAIAPDKEALLPGSTTSFANVSGYSRGINGVMIDVADLPGADFLTASDLTFETGPGRGETPFAAAPAPSEFFFRRNAGVGGSDRIVLAWLDGALANTRLRVTLPAGELTGLARPDVFYFANVVGDTCDDGRGEPDVSAFDMTRINRARSTPATGSASPTPTTSTATGCSPPPTGTSFARTSGPPWIGSPRPPAAPPRRIPAQRARRPRFFHRAGSAPRTGRRNGPSPPRGAVLRRRAPPLRLERPGDARPQRVRHALAAGRLVLSSLP